MRAIWNEFTMLDDLSETIDLGTLNQWFCIGQVDDISPDGDVTMLLGTQIDLVRDGDDIRVSAQGRTLPTQLRYGYIWTSLGAPKGDVFDIPETIESDRRYVPCGAIRVAAAGPRVVENFLDMAHFPFVHTDILGSEPHTEVLTYKAEIRRDVDEVWATDCKFTQPKAALSAEGAIETEYMYRVTTPFAAVLYKTCPVASERWDVIALFVQPMQPGLCRAHPVMFLIDDGARDADLISFQQVIFLQDRIILENQRPVLLPIEPRIETPTRADAISIAYRRWLKEKGCVYGTSAGPKADAA